MTEQPNDTDWLAGLEDAVRRKAYDCDCQVGGVDAMSIDTDYLSAAVAGIRADMAAREAAAWDEGYRLGVNDERMSQDLTGGEVPAGRVNPHRVEREESVANCECRYVGGMEEVAVCGQCLAGLADEIERETKATAWCEDARPTGLSESNGSGERPTRIIDGAQHNHFTRDIKPPGQCPACDRHWAKNFDAFVEQVKVSGVEYPDIDGGFTRQPLPDALPKGEEDHA